MEFFHSIYNYRLIKDISPYIDISESTLYPILRRLEGAQLVTVYSMAHNGRLRKYYRITRKGRKALDARREEWATFREQVDAVVNGASLA